MKIKAPQLILDLKKDAFSEDTAEALKNYIQKFTEEFLKSMKEV